MEAHVKNRGRKGDGGNGTGLGNWKEKKEWGKRCVIRRSSMIGNRLWRESLGLEEVGKCGRFA